MKTLPFTQVWFLSRCGIPGINQPSWRLARSRNRNIERAGLRAWLFEPNYAALSNYERGEPFDWRWIEVGILVGVVSMPVAKARLGTTNFIYRNEEFKTRQLVEEDRLWFAVIQDQRKPTAE